MPNNESKLYYLATPYSHPLPHVRQQRFEIANQIAARLMKSGTLIFSPISHTHPIALSGDLPTGFDYWEKYDRAMLERCAGLIVITQDGWLESIGVQAEIRIAKELNLGVLYIDANSCDGLGEKSTTCKIAQNYRELIDDQFSSRGIKYSKIESDAGMAGRTISKVINGDQRLSARVAYLLEKHLQMDAKYLLRLQAEFYYEKFLDDFAENPNKGIRVQRSSEVASGDLSYGV